MIDATDTTDRDGFDLVSLLRENAALRIQLADAVAEADYLRVQLERQLAPRQEPTMDEQHQ